MSRRALHRHSSCAAEQPTLLRCVHRPGALFADSPIVLASMNPFHQLIYGVAVAGLMTLAALFMLILLIYTTINQIQAALSGDMSACVAPKEPGTATLVMTMARSPTGRCFGHSSCGRDIFSLASAARWRSRSRDSHCSRGIPRLLRPILRFSRHSTRRSLPGGAACAYRQLQCLSHTDGRRALCRRPAAGDAVRHHPRDQHHAGSRYRHRPLVGSGFPPRDARRRGPRRPASLSGLSLRSLHQSDGRGYPRDLRVPDDARAGARAGAGERAAVSPQHPPADRSLEAAVLPCQARFQPDAAQGAELESRRLSGRRPRRIAARCHTPRNALGAEKRDQTSCRRRSGRLARAGLERELAGAGRRGPPSARYLSAARVRARATASPPGRCSR